MRAGLVRARGGFLATFVAAILVAPAASEEPRGPEASGVAHKRAHSPVDPSLVAWASAPAALRSLRASPAPEPDPWPMILRGDGIVIHAASKGDPRALLVELEAIGLREGVVSGNAISGVLPREAIGLLESCAGLAVARPALATTQQALARHQRPAGSGAVTSQGVVALGVDELPAPFDGGGTSVGILSDTFDCLGGFAADAANGDLPADVAILDDPDLSGCVDEGRALAHLVHDVSPRSRLGFHTAFNGKADFAEGILELAHQFGADVIVDDILYFDEPYYQDGAIARAVDTVVDQGVAFVSAAGNAGRRSSEAPFRDSGQTGFFQHLGETRRHDFDPGPGVDVFQTLTLPPGAVTILILQWDEPFVSASTASPPRGADSDYDLLVYVNENPIPNKPSAVFASSTAFNPGGDAFEGVVLRNPSDSPREVYLAIERFSLPGIDGPDVERMKMIHFGSIPELEWDWQSGTSTGHANARGAIAVGAAAWFETPRFGVAPPQLEPYSSAGGVPIVLDPAGERLPAPAVRETPDLVGPDGVNTPFFPAPGDVPEDDDDFPNFFGTSAAAPHVAGVAALLQGRERGGAAVVDRDGALLALQMCFTVVRGRVGLPLTVRVALERVPEALASGATLGPCRSLSPDEIEWALESSALDMGTPGYDFDSGHGFVDAPAAARALRGLRRDPFRGPADREALP